MCGRIYPKWANVKNGLMCPFILFIVKKTSNYKICYVYEVSHEDILSALFIFTLSHSSCCYLIPDLFP